ncbi:MAG TPA: transglycosylase SLT domain-containing protein [Solirubrobacterales bacterium]|nr:transglycosylase SLT domain-containing protein [Solirubrobacterales bacterium]
MSRDLVIATSLGDAKGGVAVAAAVGVALSHTRPAVLVAELGARAGRGPTMLAAASARELEDALRAGGFDRVAARGRLCWLGLDASDDALGELGRAVHALPEHAVAIAHLPAELWQEALSGSVQRPSAALLRADLPRDRSLTAMSVIELRDRGIPVRVAARAPGRVASRRALAGLEAGGSASQRAGRLARGLGTGRSEQRRSPVARSGALMAERGQALFMVIAAAFVVLFCAAVLTALGGAVTGAARTQRAADLAALSGARSLRDDFPRLFTPVLLPSGASNPQHLDKDEYLERATAAAKEAATRNGVDADWLRVSFPDRESFAPTRVKASVTASLDTDSLPGGNRSHSGHGRDQVRIEASGVAEASPPATGTGTAPTMASGGGYSGPLVYRQGKPMRPDVAEAFDRLAAAAQHDGIAIVITSAFRSDAEQAELWEQNPDPRWVAPPGQSLHRCATELDLGPSSAYGWLDANAPRFDFLRRYSWEAWHFGFTGGPAPCSSAGDAVGMPTGGGEPEPTAGLPSFVPERFREPILRSASRWNVSAGVLAAQLMAESNFNPFAVSPVGAQGIAQFMPSTAALYGLDDPFDAPAAIDAQAHLMSDLLRQFGGSVSLALAAYNAGPGPVAACQCVPDIPETEAYVARILGLLGGAGELITPTLEVRLVA